MSTPTLIRAAERAARHDRRRLVQGMVALAASALTGCDKLSNNPSFVDVLKSAEPLNKAAQGLLAGSEALAQEFSPADIAPTFRSNGTLMPSDADYQALQRQGFADYTLRVGGLVSQPAAYGLAQLRAMPSRTQITRHDCVEGWSCIGQWTGVPLAQLLDAAKPLAAAKYVVFHCFDSMDATGPDAVDSRYYESIDLDDAHHAQTLLAYDLNGRPLPISNGAPLRLRVERQLGYKHAKFVRAIELVDSYASIRGGQGGYWEDEGYEWYAGI